VLYNFRGGGSRLLYDVIKGREGTIKLTFLALYNMWTAPNRDLHTPFTQQCHFEWP